MHDPQPPIGPTIDAHAQWRRSVTSGPTDRLQTYKQTYTGYCTGSWTNRQTERDRDIQREKEREKDTQTETETNKRMERNTGG